jgi:hypothetical protein
MKSNTIWIILIAILAIGAYLYFSNQPTTITNPDGTTTTDTGWFLKLFDKDGNEIPVPQNFMITSSQKGLFSIWTTESPITCTTDANCPSGSTCWTSMCVIRNVASMSLGFSVKSTSTTVTYNSLKIGRASCRERV